MDGVGYDAVMDLMAAQATPASDEQGERAAKVVRVDQDGTAWVHYDGGADETPCVDTLAEVAAGDMVLVEIRGGRAVIKGSTTAPSISAAKASEMMVPIAEAASNASSMAASAQASAKVAEESAAAAVESAAAAAEVVEVLDEMAEESGKTVEQILRDAGTASEAAASAQQSADKAQNKLSDVERVVGTVNWIAEHGRYVSAAGTTFDPERVYYTRSDEVYELTQDTAIDLQKTYYERSGSGTEADPYVYTAVASPVVEDIATYYELVSAKYTVVPEPVAADLASYYYLVIDESVQNYIASHLWLDDYGLNLSVDSADGWRVHQGTVDGTKAMGTYILDPNDVVVMTMNANGVLMGKVDETHTELDYHSLQLIDKESYQYFYVSDLRDTDGEAVIYGRYRTTDLETPGQLILPLDVKRVNRFMVDGGETEYTIDSDNRTIIFSQASSMLNIEIWWVTESRLAKAYTVGIRNLDPGANATVGPMSVALGVQVSAAGYASVAEGGATSAVGDYSHAEGCDTGASGEYSHAEGWYSGASGRGGHAEGYRTSASGKWSHAEGYYTKASGPRSHAQNEETIAASADQTAIGKYNVADANGTYAAIIGNGTSDSARSNALAVEWDGTVHGKLFIGTGCTWGQLAAKFTWGQLAGRS